MRTLTRSLVVLAACERRTPEPTRDPAPPIKDKVVEPVRPGPFDPFPRAQLAKLTLPAGCTVQGDAASCRDYPIGDTRCELEVDAEGGLVRIVRAHCELGAEAVALTRLRSQMVALARYGSFGSDAQAPADEIATYFDSLREMSDGISGVGFQFHRSTSAGGLGGVVARAKDGYAVTYEWTPIERDLVVEVPDMWRGVARAPHVVSFRPRPAAPYEVVVTIVRCDNCTLSPSMQSEALGERLPELKLSRTVAIDLGGSRGVGTKWLYYVSTPSGGVDLANELWLTTAIDGGQLVVAAKYEPVFDHPLDPDARPNVAEIEERLSPATILDAAIRVATAYLRAHPRAK